MQPATTESILEALHQRIQQIAEDFNQSEIARKTGTSRNNVSRYVRGAKMPLDFGASLAMELGVNPVWLLTGEGSQWLSDTTEGTAKMAGDILELVEAMNAVARMRLGSLTGKHHLRVLRELNGALVRYEKLRVELNVRTTEIFDELMGQYTRALAEANLDVSDDLRRALAQLARLNDDDLLQAEFRTRQAQHEYLLGNLTDAVELQREIVYYNLSRGGVGREALMETHNMAMTLYHLSRFEEAKRILTAALALAPDDVKQTDAYQLVDAMLGVIMVELGEVPEGLVRVQRRVAELAYVYKGRSGGLLARTLLLAGVTNVEAMAAHGEMSPGFARRLLQFVAWNEDPEQLENMRKQLVGPDTHQIPEGHSLSQYLEAMANAFEGDEDAVREYIHSATPRRNVQMGSPLVDLYLPVNHCRLYRIVGDQPRALQCLERADELRKKVPEDVTVDVLSLAGHYRNVLELVDEGTRSRKLKQMLKDAKGFFREQVGKGFGLLLEFAQQHLAETR